MLLLRWHTVLRGCRSGLQAIMHYGEVSSSMRPTRYYIFLRPYTHALFVLSTAGHQSDRQRGVRRRHCLCY